MLTEGMVAEGITPEEMEEVYQWGKMMEKKFKEEK